MTTREEAKRALSALPGMQDLKRAEHRRQLRAAFMRGGMLDCFYSMQFVLLADAFRSNDREFCEYVVKPILRKLQDEENQ